MACTIEHDGESFVDEDVIEAAWDFAADCEKKLPDETFNLRVQGEDNQGWVAYLYGMSNYGSEIVAMMSRSWYHFEDTYFMSDEDVDILKEIVCDFCRAISPDGQFGNLST